MPNYDLDGQSAIITGGGRGIGRAIALRLAREGVRVAIADIDEEGAASVAQEASAMGADSIHQRVDVTQELHVEKLVADAVVQFGRVDIMCANAGILAIKPLVDTDEATWDRIFAVNAKGVFFCNKHAARQMIKQQSGRIVNTASVVAKIPPGPDVPLSAYTASKHAVVGITQSIAQELAEHNILVNCICPTVVETSMWEMTNRHVSSVEDSPAGSFAARLEAGIPLLHRALTPEEVAGVVAFLCSSDSSYDTGQAINISGGTASH